MQLSIASVLRAAIVLQAAVVGVLATPTSDLLAPRGWAPPKHTSPRPPISYHPHRPGHPPPPSPPRTKVCYVQSHNDSVTDDSPYILQAIHQCNPGGHVVFSQGYEYIIGTALDLTFLKNIDLGKPIVHFE